MNAETSLARINKMQNIAVAALLIYLAIYYGIVLLVQRDYAVIASDLMSLVGIIVSMIFLLQAIQLCPLKKIRRIMFYFFWGAVFFLLGDILPTASSLQSLVLLPSGAMFTIQSVLSCFSSASFSIFLKKIEALPCAADSCYGDIP